MADNDLNDGRMPPSSTNHGAGTVASVAALVISPPGRFRDGLRVLLRASGMIARIEMAKDAGTSLDMVAQHPLVLAFLDAGLPGNEAWSTLEQLKSRGAGTLCCVLCSTHNQGYQAKALGADFALRPGFSTPELFSVIAQVAARSNGPDVGHPNPEPGC